MISFIGKVHKKQFYRHRKEISCLGQRVGMGLTNTGQDRPFWGYGNVLKLGCDVNCATL